MILIFCFKNNQFWSYRLSLVDWPHRCPCPWVSTLDHPLEVVQSQSLSLETAPEGGVLHTLSLLSAPGTKACWRLSLPPSVLSSSPWKWPLWPGGKAVVAGDTSGFWASLPFPFCLRSFILLCPKHKRLKNWRNEILFHWQSMKLPSSYPFNAFPTICMSSPLCTPSPWMTEMEI